MGSENIIYVSGGPIIKKKITKRTFCTLPQEQMSIAKLLPTFQLQLTKTSSSRILSNF